MGPYTWVKQIRQRRESTKGVGSSLKLGEQKGGLLWRARAWDLGAEPPAGIQVAEPPVVDQGASLPEAGGVIVLEDTFMRCTGSCSGSRSDRSDRTEAYISYRYRYYFECK